MQTQNCWIKEHSENFEEKSEKNGDFNKVLKNNKYLSEEFAGIFIYQIKICQTARPQNVRYEYILCTGMYEYEYIS